jgi:hypothetical protein
VTVESIDFSQWLKRTVAPDDYVILSMDIEGAEYDVLDKMLQDGAFKHVDRLYVESTPICSRTSAATRPTGADACCCGTSRSGASSWATTPRRES